MISIFARRAFLALLCGTVGVFSASAVTQNPGELFVGFRASGGAGSTKDYLVNIGPASQFTAATVPLTLSLGNLGADLSSGGLFASAWQSRADLFWGINGTSGSFAAVGNDPAKTLYATRARPSLGVPSAPWDRASDTAQGVTTTKMNGLATAFKAGTATANTSVGVIQNTTDANSYASYQPGGSLPNSGPAPGISFARFSPSNEASFGGGTAGALLDLYRILPGSGPSEHVGFFTISDAGAITFIPKTVTVYGLDNLTYSVSEEVAGGILTFNVLRGGNTSVAGSVNVSTTTGTAAAGTDFSALSNFTVIFAAGETTKAVAVDIVNRPGFQGDRTFALTLSGGTLLGASSAEVTIVETAPAPAGTISFTSASQFQSPLNSAGKPNLLAITIERANPTAAVVSVDVTVTGGSLLRGTDYTLNSPTTVTFVANAATVTLNIPLTAAGANRTPGTIELTLSNPTNTALLGSNTTTTINVAQTGTVSFLSSNLTGGEVVGGDKVVKVTVQRVGGSAGVASVQIARTGGTATPDVDFAANLPATVTWADGEVGPKTVDITIKADAITEAARETILLALQNANGIVIGTPSTATLTIFDPDATLPTLTLNTPRISQRVLGSGVTVSGTAKDNIGVGRVDISIDGGAAVSVFLSSPSTTLNFSKSVIPEQGSHLIKVVAFDVVGNASAAITRRVIFTNVRPSLAGTYNGLIVGAPGLGTFRTNGLVKLTVNTTGALTGLVRVGTMKQAITGVVGSDGSVRFGRTNATQIAVGRPAAGFLALQVDLKGGKRATGTLRATASKSSKLLGTVIHADLATPASSKLVGKYTVIFQAGAAPNNGKAAAAYPQGDGYAFLTVARTGLVSMVGKLADGTTITYGNNLSRNGDWPVHALLYGNRGYVNGNVVFDRAQPQTDASCADMRWFRNPNAPLLKGFRAGWPTGITVEFAASRYVASGNPIGGSGAVKVSIALADGGLVTATSNDATVAATGVVSVGGATGATKLTAKLTRATGALSGSFTHPVGGKPTTFAGVAYQKTKSAAGFFTGGPANASGSVTVTKKP
jgi:hypothetical protein